MFPTTNFFAQKEEPKASLTKNESKPVTNIFAKAEESKALPTDLNKKE